MKRWLIELWRREPLLTRDEFVAKYLPQYTRAYNPPVGIRAHIDKNGKYRVPMSTRGSIQAQVTKRNNRIDSEYAEYCAMHAEEMKVYAEVRP
jgi:hypothetical protein